MRARLISMTVLAASLLVASRVTAASDGDVTFGGQWWNQSANEAKFQEFRVVPQGGFLGSFALRQFDGAWATSVWGANGLQADQRTGASIAKGVHFRVDAEYNGIPHLYSSVARSAFAQTAPGVFTLPDSLQRLLQNAADTAGTSNAAQRAANAAYYQRLLSMQANAPGVGLGMQTDVSKLRLRARPIKDWQFEVKGVRRERSGSLAWGVPFGIGSSTMTEVPVPISQRMIDADATGTWTHGRYRVAASAGMSAFHNNISTLRVDNSRRLTDSANKGTGVAQMDLWPDNNVARGRVSFSATDLPVHSQFTATVGVSQATQDDQFLPFTSNSTIAQSRLDSLPVHSLDGKINTTVQDYRLTSRVNPKLFTTLRFHGENNDNKTPMTEFDGFSPYDASFSAGVIENDQWGGSNDVFGLDVDYSLMDNASLTLMGEHRAREHKFREVEKDKENVYGAKLRVTPMPDVDVNGGFRYGQRKLDDILLEDYENAAGQVIEPLGLRRFDVANRNQTAANAGATWTVNPQVDLAVNWQMTNDDYKDSQYGLLSNDNSVVFTEATWHATKRLDVTGGYGFGTNDADQASDELSQSFRADTSAIMDWGAKIKDENQFAFAHADWWLRPNKLVVKVDYNFTRAKTTFDLRNTTTLRDGTKRAAAVDVPDTFNRTHDVLLTAMWHYNPSIDLSCQFEYLQYRAVDFAVQNIPLVGGSYSGAGATLSFSPNALYLGDSLQNYDARRIAVMATRRF